MMGRSPRTTSRRLPSLASFSSRGESPCETLGAPRPGGRGSASIGFGRTIRRPFGAAKSAREVLHAFERWPTWMWANEEVVALAKWLGQHNNGRPDDQKAGFYGLDVYSLWDSLYAVMAYLHRVDPEALPAAWRALRCF